MTTVRQASASPWSDVAAVPETRSALRAVRGLGAALVRGKRPPVVPLFLHGAPGTGKSHLVAALLRELATDADGVTARVLSAGDAARWEGDGDAGFAEPDLLACDLLVLEDVQLLPARAANAVGGLLDERANRRKAVVVTARAGPASFTHLPRKLTSRFAAGLVVQLEPLSAASRKLVLVSSATARGVRLTDDALDWLANQFGGVRALLGTVQNLAQVAAGYPGPIDRAAAEEIVAGTGQPTSHGIDVGFIVKRVAAAFGINEKELLGPSRLRRVLVPRQVAMYLARSACGLSLPRVGAAFGRDHTTVMHAIRKVEAEMEADEQLAGVVRGLRMELR